MFNPNDASPVCIDKPPLAFSDKVSVVSEDLIQNLKPQDMAVVQTLFQKSDMAITTDDLPHYILHYHGVHSSVMQSGKMLTDKLGNTTECNVFELPAPSFDLLPDNQLPQDLEDEMCQSTTNCSHNLQKLNSELTQDGNLDTAECSDTPHPGLTPVNQISGSTTDLDQQEPSTAINFQPSKLNQMLTFSNLPSRLGNTIQLDQLAYGDSSSQSQNYILLTTQKNRQGQQASFTPMADIHTNFDDSTNDLDALVVNGNLPPTSLNYTYAQNNEFSIINECNQEMTELDVCGHDQPGQSPPTGSQDDTELDSAAKHTSTLLEDCNSTASQDDESHALDLDKHSVVSYDLTEDLPEPHQQYHHDRPLNNSEYVQYSNLYSNII